MYFHGYVLEGYTVEIRKADNTLLGSYSQAVDPPNVTIAGIKEHDGVVCVAVNGFTIHGNGPFSSCTFEEHDTLCMPCNLVSRLFAYLRPDQRSWARNLTATMIL